jgi:uncharacterized protein DUF5682
MMSGPTTEVLGIRHHGPGSARSLLRALEDLEPDAVLIEGPSDADPLIAMCAGAGMQPPVALLGYAVDDPGTAAFWPYAVFSPEWQAMTWAVRRGVHVAFCDLPAASTPALAERADPGSAATPAAGSAVRRDPLAALASAAGYDDPERWWDDVVESRLDGASPFPALLEAMAALREEAGPGSDREEELREAWMRRVLRATLKAGHRRVAVVCGAWHAPALSSPLPPAAADTRTLKGLAKRKVALTWVPWTHSRLASGSGYAAGVTSPGWYHHLWTAPDRPVTRWLTGVAHSLRERDLPVSTAHVIDAVRLADHLAGLRGRPLAGLSEVDEATRAVLCEGDAVAARFVTDHLVVGERLGSVPEDVPTVPLEADLARTCRTLRLRREPLPRALDLDLRKPGDLARSRLFHRLRLLDIGWAAPAASDVRSTGTFRETWALEWQPHLSVAVVEAAAWGTTVPAAASARTADLAGSAGIAVLTSTLEDCLKADLPDSFAALLRALDRQAAVDADVVHLMESLPALVRARRYGDVRGTDVSALAGVAAALLLRICTALPQAVTSLDDDGAAMLRRHVDAVQSAVALGAGPAGAAGDDQERWLATLAGLVDRADVHGMLVGRMVRILRDAGRLADAPVRLHRALSVGMPAPQKAGWVDGFFADGALLLIHDRELLTLLDSWVAQLPEQEFVDVLPLVRRTFGSFSAAERRSIAMRVRSGDRGPVAVTGDDVDEDRGLAAVATVAAILGVRS